MPSRSDVKKILVIGSGPIRIGQGCEFDYSGTQACTALRDCGYETVLVNSNPATIMTDPEIADTVYIEPLNYEFVKKIIEKERPDGVLPTMGGQVALNLFMELHEKGDLERLGVTMLGVTPKTVETAEDRALFKKLVTDLGYHVVKGGMAHTREEAFALARTLNYPLIIRASFTLGGAGGGIAHTPQELEKIIDEALEASVHGEIAIEESIINWKEYELEVMRDGSGNFVVVCGIENINPMGVHTGDSITVAPCMTLTDREYQQLRDIARRIFEAIGMETGGANIQFAVHPNTGEVVVIEMNPRVSRSSALVSKATGYPIARLSAKLAVGYTLDELENEITGCSPAAFEPVIDYVAVKIPRWNFERFAGDDTLGIAMKSVGEVLAFGSTFKDAFQKAWRSLELGFQGWPQLAGSGLGEVDEDRLNRLLQKPTPALFPAIKTGLINGATVEEMHEKTRINRWFLHQLEELVQMERRMAEEELNERLLRRALQFGFTRTAIATLSGLQRDKVETLRAQYKIKPTFKMVDTCAGEFQAQTPYYFKTWEHANDNRISENKKVVILGSGPNRIGQGIEFDYACVHAVAAAREMGYDAILVNCNPETVSTDYHVSDKLYVEPLTAEDVLDLLEEEKPTGVLMQFGGQTPLKFAVDIEEAGYKILGSSYETIELCENREEFGAILDELQITAPPYGTAFNLAEAEKVADRLGFPVLVRPSYVIGGQGMGIVNNRNELDNFMESATEISPEHPVLIDRYLGGASEFDVDLLCDGTHTFIPAILQHVEEAGVHSGDSSCMVPPVGVPQHVLDKMMAVSRRLALRLKVKGVVNIQFAVMDEEVYVLEVNPRSSRTVPFVAKAAGVPLADYAARLALGGTLADLGLGDGPLPMTGYAAKAPVFPFKKFPGTPPYPGPEMRSLGEVMGRASTPGEALARAWMGAELNIHPKGSILCLRAGKPSDMAVLKGLPNPILASPNAFPTLKAMDLNAANLGANWQEAARKLLTQNEAAMVIDMTLSGAIPQSHHQDGAPDIAELAVHHGIPLITTPGALKWAVTLFDQVKDGFTEVKPSPKNPQPSANGTSEPMSC